MTPASSNVVSAENLRRRHDAIRPASIITLLAAATLLIAASPASAAYSETDREDCRSGDLDRVVGGCTHMLESQISIEDRVIALTNRARAFEAKGDRDRAIVDYNDAIRIDPKYGFAHINRGNHYYAKGDYDRAIADYDEAIQFDSTMIDAMRNRGLAYGKKGDYATAITAFGEAIQADPNFVVAYENRADSYVQTGDFDRAIADYDAAIKLKPDTVGYWTHRGAAYAGIGNFARAIADYDQALSLEPKNSGVYFSRGIANLYGATAAKAVADFDQVVALNPKDSYAPIWREIAAQRDHQPSRIADALGSVDVKAWPGPLLKLYAAGQLTPATAIATGDDARLNAIVRRGRLCEINFYSAELALQKGAKDVALPLLRKVVADCPRDFLEFGGAKAELKLNGAE
jgi:tetratricopeptide (TPR) repeat protein